MWSRPSEQEPVEKPKPKRSRYIASPGPVPSIGFMSGVFRPRAGGKTTELVKIAEENANAWIVVNNGLQAKRLIDKYPHLEDQIVTLPDVLDGRKFRDMSLSKMPSVLLIDDFEHAIRHLLPPHLASHIGAYVIAATGTTL